MAFRPHKTLDQILANRASRNAFIAFLKVGHTEDNYEFLQEVQRYKRFRTKTRARAIYTKYLRDLGDLNVSGEVRDAITARVNALPAPAWWRLGSPPRDLFDPAVAEVRSLLTGQIEWFGRTPEGARYAFTDAPPAHDGGPGLGDIGGGLAGADAAAGGHDGIAPPPDAPPPAPGVERPDEPADGRGPDGRGRDHEHDSDEKKDEGHHGEARR